MKQSLKVSYLEVDCERRNLLRKAKKVDGSVQQAWLKFSFQVDGALAGFSEMR